MIGVDRQRYEATCQNPDRIAGTDRGKAAVREFREAHRLRERGILTVAELKQFDSDHQYRFSAACNLFAKWWAEAEHDDPQDDRTLVITMTTDFNTGNWLVWQNAFSERPALKEFAKALGVLKKHVLDNLPPKAKQGEY